MSNLESNQNPTDRIQQQTGSDQAATPLVNMANPNEVQGTFPSAQEGRGQAVSADGQMIFSNPYGSGEGSAHGGNWHHDGEHHQGGQGGTDATIASASAQAGADAGVTTSAAASGDSTTGQLEAQLAQLKTEIAQLTAEVTQLFGGNAGDGTTAPASNSDGSTVAKNTTGSTPSDGSTAAAAASTGSDSSTASAAASIGSDSSTASAAASTPSDSSSTVDTGPAASTTTSDGSTIAATTPSTNSGTTGLSVQGDQLLDNGKPFVAVGINDTTSTEHNELTSSLPTIAAEGANTIRIMGQASDLTGGTDNAFHQEVQAALDAGLKVDLALNSDTAIYGQTGGVLSSADVAEGANALYTAAAQYGNNPNVMYNVMNEQGASGDATNPTLLSNTEALEQAVVQGAQSTNPGAKPVIVVDDSEWGQGGYDSNYQGASFLYNNAAALEQAGNGNVVGAVHNYDSGSSYTNDGITAIQQEGMPVIAEEVGYNPSSINLSEQVQSTTGEPVGGLVWVDGSDPQTGSFYNNVLADQNTAPAVQQFWQTVNSEAASATPVTA